MAVCLLACGGGAALLIFMIVILAKLMKPKAISLEKRHVVITGGSSGIGKSVAIEAAKRGAHVTIIARNVDRLESAKGEILKACKFPGEQKVQYLSIDISDDYEAIDKCFNEIDENFAPVYMLVNCAGLAICGKLEDTTVQDIKYMMNVNYLGTVYPTKAIISKMKSRREGKIVITSSQAGLLGIFGLSCYSSTKFALRGLAESLHMECQPYNISITLSLPPDTDTPGFADEEKSKPMETRLISESAGLLSPDLVGKKLLDDALDGGFYSTVGFESFILKTLCAGMKPVSTIAELISEILLMGILRLVGVFYLMSFQGIINNCMKTRDQTKKSE